MIRSKSRPAGMLAGGVATVLLLAACSSGDATEPDPSAANVGEVVAEGEGVSLNEYGGAQLARGEPQHGGSVRVGMSAPIESLDPTIALSTPGTSAAMAVYDTLMKLAPDGKIVPNLAESLESADHKSWTLKLPEGIAFTDGTPYNAQAVVAHLERYTAPTSQARDAGIVRQIDHARAVNPLTVEITLKDASVEFPSVFTGSAGMVPSPTALKKHGDQYGLHPVGAGAFKVKTFQPGGDLVLVRNPDYRDPDLPYLDKLVMVTATDSQSRFAALQAGSIDLASTQTVTDFADAREAGLAVLQQPAYTYFYYMLNLSKPPFDDPRMREALIRGINTEALSTAVFEGKQPPMKGYVVPHHPEYVETDYPAYDVEAARALVEEYVADGGDPTFEITITAGPEFQRQTSVIQQMLSDIGVDMKITVSDQPTMITEGASGNYQAQMRFIGMTLDLTSDMLTRFHSNSPGNITRSGNAELDKLLETLEVTPVEERSDLYAQAQEVLTEWMPTVPLVQQVGAWIANDNVGGFPGSQGESTIDMIDWKEVWAAK